MLVPWAVRTFTSDTGQKPVEDWLRSLEPEARAVVINVIDLLEEHGAGLGMPHARSLGNGLWELRARDQSGIYRKGRIPGAVHVQIETARRRQATWLAREERHTST